MATVPMADLDLPRGKDAELETMIIKGKRQKECVWVMWRDVHSRGSEKRNRYRAARSNGVCIPAATVTPSSLAAVRSWLNCTAFHELSQSSIACVLVQKEGCE